MNDADALQGLNPSQREAVLHESGPLFVLAGAGSGKTRVITHRIAHLIQSGCPPDGVLAITFTNKAADEMKERTERLCSMKSPWISTFHSFCARILRRHIHSLPPYDNSFTIYDADDSRALIREVLKELDVATSLWNPRSAQEEISRIKNSGAGDGSETFGADYLYGQVFRNIYLAYIERLKERNAADFDDLLLLTVRLFEEHPEVLARYQEQFHHVLVDECQDINSVQYRIGRLLTTARRNLCITGDPDQSIYKWRGADITNLLKFEQDYPDARVVMLERNYRSTKNILHVANALIRQNQLRKPKSLWTENPDGEPVRVYRFLDEEEEAREIAALVQGLRDEGIPAGAIAIFYRINSISRPVEQEFIYANIPYSMVGGIQFFLRKEVKDILAYLRIIDNPRDAESLKRIINVPSRGIGKSTLEKLMGKARAEKRGLLDVLLDRGEAAPSFKKGSLSLARFAELYRQLAEKRKSPVADLVRETIQATGYENYLSESYGEEATERRENISELVNAAAKYDEGHPDGKLTGFLQMVNLLGDVDRWEPRGDRVSFMTLHSAKGLEFPVAVIAGLEDGILPLLRADDPEADIEEERRLFYVGITRAKERLYITHAASRLRFGRVRQSFPSRFLYELQDRGEEAEKPFEKLEMDLETEESLARAEENARFDMRRSGAAEFEDFAATDWPSDGEGWDEDPYPIGARVYHDAYGEGEVVRVSGAGLRRRVTIHFEGAGQKQFVAGFAPLRRIK
jgi:DNA helicase-2/ATP-dependent DNA helicase PcrA